MIKKALIPLILLVLIVAPSCQSKPKGFAPENIKGMTISYLSDYTSGSADADLKGKEVIYHFKENGMYSSTFEGKEYQFGDYSFYYMSEDIVRIALSYSESNQSYTYIYIMTFDSETTGDWKTVYTNEKAITGEEKGTFSVLKS